jgi:hypothetical protein
VSSLCDTELTATYFAMGSFLPVLMLCGKFTSSGTFFVYLVYGRVSLNFTKCMKYDDSFTLFRNTETCLCNCIQIEFSFISHP